MLGARCSVEVLLAEEEEREELERAREQGLRLLLLEARRVPEEVRTEGPVQRGRPAYVLGVEAYAHVVPEEQEEEEA
jgi:hypothetical protein